tara:strand:+ start:11448 stop:12617 length:1170 start_codon:yes stop_codon:yes gene_type:complete
MSAGCIGDFLIVKGGKRLPKGSAFSESKTPHAYIRVTDFERNSLNSERLKYISKEIHEKIHRYTIQSSDVYISIAGTIGVAGIIPHSLDGSNLTENAAKLAPKEGVNIYPKYLSYFLNSPNTQSVIKSKTMAVGVPKLAIFRIKEIPINLPPLDKQKKIADILDAADTCRQKTKALITKYDELTQSLFINMFGDPVRNPMGWEKVPTIKYCDCIVPGRDKPKSFTGNLPWITTGDLRYLGFMIKSRLNIGLSKDEISEVRAKIIPKNSVIMTCVGDLGVVSINTNDIVMNQQLHAFICHDELNNVFLMHNLSYQTPYMNKMASSTTVPYMNKTVANNTPTIVPPIVLQNQFAERVQAIESQKKQAQTSLVQSENLFNSLLQRAFKGELV